MKSVDKKIIAVAIFSAILFGSVIYIADYYSNAEFQQNKATIDLAGETRACDWLAFVADDDTSPYHFGKTELYAVKVYVDHCL